MPNKTCWKSNCMSESESPVQRGGLLSLIDTGINISALVENNHCHGGNRPEPNVCSHAGIRSDIDRRCILRDFHPTDSDLDKVQKKKKKKSNMPQTSSIIRAGNANSQHYAAGR